MYWEKNVTDTADFEWILFGDFSRNIASVVTDSYQRAGEHRDFRLFFYGYFGYLCDRLDSI